MSKVILIFVTCLHRFKFNVKNQQLEDIGNTTKNIPKHKIYQLQNPIIDRVQNFKSSHWFQMDITVLTYECLLRYSTVIEDFFFSVSMQTKQKYIQQCPHGIYLVLSGEN